MIETMPHRVVERLTRFCPLGIRFWDVAEERSVTQGLYVTARSEGAEAPPTTAFRTASGAYAFHGLPGLRAVEFGDAPMSGPEVIPIQRRFVIEVVDLEKRFTRTAFVLDLPREERGLYPPVPSGSLPDNAVSGFMLFSATTRTPTSGTAAIRADLEVPTTGVPARVPAAHAILAVEIEGETNYGIADADGKVAVFFPYPAFRHTLSGSFPEGRQPLHDYTWNATVRVLYAPGTQVHLPEAEAPLLRSLFDQANGQFHAAAPTSPPSLTDSLNVEVPFGRELVLRSEDGSALLIEPA